MNLINNGIKELEVAEELVFEKLVEMLKFKFKFFFKLLSLMLFVFRLIKGFVIKFQIGFFLLVFVFVAVKFEGKVGMFLVFILSAIYFKFIIFYKIGILLLVEEKKVEEKKVEEKKVEEKRVEDVKEQDGDNDKEVVRKLKELKKNLMKYRQFVKESEVEEKEN